MLNLVNYLASCIKTAKGLTDLSGTRGSTVLIKAS